MPYFTLSARAELILLDAMTAHDVFLVLSSGKLNSGNNTLLDAVKR